LFRFLFILACFPLLFGYHIIGDFVLYPGILFPLVIIFWRRRISKTLIFLFILAVFLSVFSPIRWISLGYYLFGLVYVFQQYIVNRSWIERTFNVLIVLILFMIIMDFLDIDVISSFTNYERRFLSDSRSILPVKRPTGFYREPSSLGYFLGTMYAVATKNALKINYRSLVFCGLSTMTMSFMLIFFVAWFLFAQSRFKLIKIFVFIGSTFALFYPRIAILYQAIHRADVPLVEINLSIIKRFVQPSYAVYEYVQTSVSSLLIKGFGPGGYKEYLMETYSHLLGSDLRAGYLLNILGNYMMSFGVLFALIFLLILFKRFKRGEAFLLCLLLMQGLPVLHPVFLLTGLKVKD